MDAVAVTLLSFGVALPAVAASAWLAPQLGLVDAPRPFKSHVRAVPRSGGLGLALALLVGAVAGIAPGGDAEQARAWGLPALGFLALGWVDDRFGLRARTKLLWQAALAALAVVLGLSWGGEGLGPFPALRFGHLTPAMTVLWIVAVVTVVNFLDGIDLLTASTTCVVLAVAAGAGAGPDGGALYAAAVGAVLGFSFWNVGPARVFVGDAGSHLLGFLVATTALNLPGSNSPRALPWPVAGALLLPGVVDVGAGLVAKWRRGVPLAAAHKDHPYQRLTRLGLPHAAVALRYGAVVLLAAFVATRGADLVGAVAAVAVGAVVLGLHLADAARAARAPASFFAHTEGGAPPNIP